MIEYSVMVTESIKQAVAEALTKLGIKNPDVSLEHPEELSHGDYSTNVALRYAKELKKSPQTIAEDIIRYIVLQKIPALARAEAAAGFVNFFLAGEFFAERIQEILEKKDGFGKQDVGKGRKVVVEFSSPNIAKPFTIGHLRSTIIGDAVAKTLSFLGYSVIRDNHLGDWGTQFGKMIVAIKKWGDIQKIAENAAPVRALVDLYVCFHAEAKTNIALEDEAREWFVKLEKGDEEARGLWKQCVAWSMKEFESLYKRLGVSFDTMHGESFFEDKMRAVVEDLERKNLLKESEGARLVFFPSDSLPPLMIIKKDGGTLYATRDLATDAWRKREYGDGVIIVNETGGEQSLYFKQVFMLEEMLGWFARGERVHIGHGLTRGKEGKMSTREGNTIWLEDVLDEAVKRAEAINKETAEIVGIGALKFNDLKREAKQDTIFDWNDVLNMKGDSGPYLQYSYARAMSVIRKSPPQLRRGAEFARRGGGVTTLERLLYRFPEVVLRAGKDYAPHFIATYLIELAGAFNNWYAKERILNAGEETEYRLALTAAFAQVMKNGLWLLGIAAPEKM
ncbi:MAG: arginine--tRNA ligase [Candidatus Taylorbacteria bacterium RIFCSPHIGHO2_02_FULL_47_18]|uniref:Arginine--tRNA ligase n=1 Tax=Candidatus Taylorbacteria bacterium RIFCSPLOWO2_01_FULL_48_100 TaxID=1802322 RepID=A0A1G2NEU4_9BACT|nr:MAG: arginine--tRNA ligase [Candidatus Taylorbacteria bacterium RIFCSPHIGHO2_01_FULL_48_38]OHA27520.1 MAG: arginine--tRNA ligase [Candidatus Taylorbacteria bacterium RIFCSPHIGHO2_02_FULL_47_18]OHA34584.1 MAG: arginine--tRNA ligase [Candidatus Taylorbacteria bacterium RIFCSPLOWO2_01_FULL_48_100]OHA40347.1 MAG: arginine--tRNA ligase [Candidatus Taylorbacteria bacterium RIFCSPLOWO2_02_FULL_48_16]OHA45228.1 MAG: arginine--tRNA ligase [Candidatus Taylorbacteria bacterium RIFCSPLOWO2_12_FULL_48_11